jgi:hypothetical protein
LTVSIDSVLASIAQGKGGLAAWTKALGVTLANTDAPYDAHTLGIPAGTYNATKVATSFVGPVSNGGLYTFPSPVSPDVRLLTAVTGGHRTTTTTAGQSSTLLVADYLLHQGGFDASSSALQSVTQTDTLPRYTDGEGVALAVIPTATTAGVTTSVTLTVKFTDSDGNTNQTLSYSTPISGHTKGRMWHADPTFWVPLPAGKRGIRKIESVQQSASAGAAGTYALLLYRPLVIAQVTQDGRPLLSLAQGQAARLYDGHCLGVMALRGLTSLSSYAVDLALEAVAVTP